MERGGGAGKRAVVACALLAGAAAILLLVKGLYPADLPESRNPNFVDNVFDNRGVLWAARLLLVSAAGVLAFGGVFIVISIAVRMKNREWLRRAGPFEISEDPLHHSEDEAEFWRKAAVRSREETVALGKQLRRYKELLRHFEEPR